MFAFLAIGLVSLVLSQETGWEESRLGAQRNSSTHGQGLTHITATQS